MLDSGQLIIFIRQLIIRYLLVHIIVVMIIASQSYLGAECQSIGKEYLSNRFYPHL